MAGWINLPLKRSDGVDYKKPLEKFIKNTFSAETATENEDAISELAKLRNTAVMQTLDKHESALEPLLRYYDQLGAMEGKLPISESQIRISFTWYDAFDKGSLFGYRKSSMSSLQYERLCVLFNIGVLQGQIAAAQNFQSDEGLKTAAKMFQNASGAFQLLKETVFPQLHQVPTPDLSVEMLVALSAIMLAQGQESIWNKTEQDKMKDAIIAKVAAQAADYYKSAYSASQVTSVKQVLEKEWITILLAKSEFFKAIAEYHQARVAQEKGAYGEGVTRFKQAEQLMGNAVKQSLGLVDCKTWQGRIQREAAALKKDNEFIYHERTPDIDSLTVIGRAALAKSLPPSKPASTRFVDLFTKLVPMAVHNALQAYESRKGEIINFEVGRLREGTQLMNSVLASLNLPAAIEDLSGQTIPKSVLDKSAAVNEKGGLNAIDTFMQDLPELLQRNREILDEATRMMDEEERQDTQMRDRFKAKWTPKPSAELTAQLRQEADKYRTIMENAVRADAVVREKYNKHRRNMDLLSKGEAELTAAIPKVGAASSSSSSSPAVQELRKLMEQVDTIKAERDGMEQDLKVQQDDMAVKFLSALAADGTIPDVEGIISSNLGAGFDSLKESVTDSIASQEKILASVQAANDKFVREKQSGQAATERETMLKDLATAYDIYMELIGNLQEGTKFYNDFTPILVRYQQKASDLVFARKTEREELSRDLQKTIANQPAEPTPQAPPHHQPTGARAPPSRPPPPSASTAAAAAAATTDAPCNLGTSATPGCSRRTSDGSTIRGSPTVPRSTVPTYASPWIHALSVRELCTSRRGRWGARGYPGYAPQLPAGYYYGGYGVPQPQGYPPQGQQPPPGGYPPR
ncbi:Rhophilin, Rho GTPase binding protein [Desmophyllum pertusum]|uniref:Rhophilin, Rho GTPase binding protein n=1 Tax=Desmophyllum pertusum TaxID=174260 RepID=A0A9W9ZMS5_9CNID|nr:Rhophilin, Rho GTPase binding protein [Desmophyllum pertusum]